ncbi:GNAT family N-acetyltransferase [Cytobacillus purgationiresistens]|uniref:RimJ/RimL family protein N-acetyltransferase n=1 Tax=Cytobacillus purgationiresistens TaxID=863449 RepID=A0ABU0AEQ9_9BACI|nr:GNAT family protein [Cytobacillus purgationiresistens]MDQ0269742.1 RimJ/RimL family protein N-acetyltransferase [Cytobacillus purgationiresistens]
MGHFVYKNFRMTDGGKFCIRIATPQDAEQLLTYTKVIFNEAPFLLFVKGEFNPTLEEQKAYIDRFLNDENKLALIAELEGEIMGFIDFSNGNRQRTMHQGTFGMSVAKEYRSKGVGKALLSSLIYWGKHNPMIEKIHLEVMSRNESAIKLYESAGFEREGIKRRAIKFNSHTYDDLIQMAYFF